MIMQDLNMNDLTNYDSSQIIGDHGTIDNRKTINIE